MNDEPMMVAACMGFDAMRIALGMAPVNYSVEQVMNWLKITSGGKGKLR